MSFEKTGDVGKGFVDIFMLKNDICKIKQLRFDCSHAHVGKSDKNNNHQLAFFSIKKVSNKTFVVMYIDRGTGVNIRHVCNLCLTMLIRCLYVKNCCWSGVWATWFQKHGTFRNSSWLGERNVWHHHIYIVRNVHICIGTCCMRFTLGSTPWIWTAKKNGGQRESMDERPGCPEVSAPTRTTANTTSVHLHFATITCDNERSVAVQN